MEFSCIKTEEHGTTSSDSKQWLIDDISKLAKLLSLKLSVGAIICVDGNSINSCNDFVEYAEQNVAFTLLQSKMISRCRARLPTRLIMSVITIVCSSTVQSWLPIVELVIDWSQPLEVVPQLK